MAIPTLAGVKAHLNITAATSDSELITFLAAARRMIERRVGPMVSTTITETVTTRTGTLLLTRRPVLSLVSLVSNLSDATVLDVSTLRFDSQAGVVYSTSGASLAGAWTITYNAGLAVVPESVELATYITVQHLWKTQRGGGQRPGMGDGDSFQAGAGAGYALPWMAIELLAGDDIFQGIA